ncbi:cytochrome b/b6 domain-containing protein [Marinobacter sp. S0848L]|uniref:cytochrome b/b6 domain-containing protein n=1 Tax=Marinobacter sp. S0848L TaxID=2926423 RepID=UPI001FF2ED18|nr:cytochrome b/b6 domain-containing protein [Marinobacter sp. S0848L]MCK0106539.1 cytochrome b/b6 domain-containing protein [Marinobacter sp. S0848L]
MTDIRLWDLPTRLFHWLLLLAVTGAVVTIKTGMPEWHSRFGLFVVGLLSFRIAWGFLGSTYARFSSFVRGPSAVLRYLRGQWQGVGHNPLGALSVLALLALFGFQAVTGLFANDEISFQGPLYPLISSGWSDTLSSWHRLTEWYLYGLVALHVLAVVWYTKVKKDNLVTPMITGKKRVPPGLASDAKGGGVVAFLVSLVLAAGVVLGASGSLMSPPPAPEPPPQNLGW